MNALIKALRLLHPTGPTGFEGFLRDLLGAVTGQHFRLLKPGHQGGIDVLEEPLGNGVVIGLEGKRYGEETQLPLDELKRKVIDAADTHPGLDLWMLATTREISATDSRALHDLGERHGLAVEVIDWPSSPEGLPTLGVLAAAAPDVVRAHLGEYPAITASLDSIRRHHGFPAERDSLVERLTRPDIGYAAARRALAAWLRRSVADLATARASLDSFANVLDPLVRRVPRPSTDSAIRGWWSGQDRPPFVLLGEEGVGKTWAVLSWWNDNAGASGDDLPLTLVIPARRVASSDPETLLADALARRTGLRDTDFWRRRLRLWLSDRRPGDTPKILLVIDGLNEHWAFKDWAALVQPLFASDWRGQFAVVLTCRPHHWQAELKSLSNLAPRSQELNVRRFDDGELDALLTLYALRRSDFDHALLELMRVPRLCHIAIERREALQASEDITRERLVYEDWKHRLLCHGAHLAIDDEEFREFVARLGRYLRDAITEGPSGNIDAIVTRRDLLNELGRDSGAGQENLAATISEIVDGRWLERIGLAHRFKLSRELAPFALGLALVDDLKPIADASGVEQRLAVFFDPLRGLDFGVDILRAAATASILDVACPYLIRHRLVEAWLSSQNFRSSDFEAFWRLIGAEPDLFIDLAVAVWMRRGGGSHGDEVLIKALSNAMKWPHVAERLRRRAIEWMAIYWLDPYAGAFLNYEPNTPEADERRRATAERLEVWNRKAGPRWCCPTIPLRLADEGDDPSWFAHRVFGVFSFLPRLQFVPAMTAWAVSRAIMGMGRHKEEMAWLLRWNPHDPGETEAAVISEVQQLLAIGHALATEAAHSLLDALATPAAMAARISARQAHQRDWIRLDTVRVDSASGVVQWNHTEARKWPRSLESPLDATLGLDTYAVDPERVLTEADALVLRELANATDPSQLWQHRSNTSLDNSVELAAEPFARWAPEVLGDLFRRAFATAPQRTGWSLRRLSLELPEWLLILGKEERVAVCAAASKSCAGVGDNEQQHTRLQLLLARLAECSAEDQIAALAELPDGPSLQQSHWSVLAPPTAADFEALERYLAADAPKRSLQGWLWYLRLASLDAMPSGYPPLIRLAQHPDAELRRLALEAIYRSADPVLAASVASSKWRYVPGMDQREAIHGSLVLCTATTVAGSITSREARERIDPHAFGQLALEYPDSDDDLDAFADFVQKCLANILAPTGSHSIPSISVDNRRSLNLLVEKRGDAVVRWLAPFLETDGGFRGAIFVDEFPLVGICKGLLHHRPETGARLWSVLMEAYERGIIRMAGFEIMPITAPDGPGIDALRDKVLDRATTDRDLFQIAEAVLRHHREAWLIRCIERDLGAPSAGVVARAMMLGGMLDVSPAADALWKDKLAVPPAPGWLTWVYDEARHLYVRNRWARYWLNLFLSERDRDRAYSYHLLFAACADRRALVWARQRIGDVEKELPHHWRTHWSLCLPNIAKQIEKSDDDLKKTLSATKIFERTQAPWL